MPAPARRRATYADLLALPEDVHAEIIDGEVVVAPSSGPSHQYATFRLAAELDGPFQRGRGGPGGWWILLDMDVAFDGGDVLRPDIAGWRRERVPRFPTSRPIADRPDWICEALSTSTARRDLGAKRATYQSARIPWYWVLDVANRELTVLRWTDQGCVVHETAGEEGPARLPPFEEIDLHVADALPPLDTREE